LQFSEKFLRLHWFYLGVPLPPPWPITQARASSYTRKQIPGKGMCRMGAVASRMRPRP